MLFVGWLAGQKEGAVCIDIIGIVSPIHWRSLARHGQPHELMGSWLGKSPVEKHVRVEEIMTIQDILYIVFSLEESSGVYVIVCFRLMNGYPLLTRILYNYNRFVNIYMYELYIIL